MQLKYIYQKTAFLMINFPTGFFQALVLILQLVKIKKGNKKVIFTGRLLGGACTLYSIGESVQCIHSLCVCVCVFSSHSFWTSSSLDVPAGVTQEEGHTGFLIHLPSAVRALIFVARRIQPFLSLVDREVEFCVLTN